MRPSRTLLFLTSVVITLSLLSVLFYPWKWESVLNLLRGDQHNSVLSDSVSHNQPAAAGLFTAALHAADTTKTDSLFFSPYLPERALKDTIERGGQFRIMFYGDSQLEGDRMTAFLRKKLRERGGGTGPGLFSPLMPVMYTRSAAVRSSSNWRRYTWLDYRHDRIPTNRFGPLLSLCRFTSPGDTLRGKATAWVKVSPAKGADHNVSVYNRLRIIYANNPSETDVRVTAGDSLITTGKLMPSDSVAVFSCALGNVPDVKVEFTGQTSPDIYAMSLESPGGVIVDNIPLRGSAGLEFVMTDRETFRQSMKILKPDLIILQYGLNVVRNVRKDYSYYEEGLVRQIRFLQDVSGGTPMLLISLTDMAELQGDSLRLFKNIPAIRDAQERAAKRTGIVFWDAWSAMGGSGSVSAWAGKNPPLAQTDLTHLSYAGSDTLAAKLVNNLFSDTSAVKPHTAALPVLATAVTTHGLKDTLTVRGNTTVIKGAGTLSATSALKKITASFFSYNPADPFIFTSPAFWIFLIIVLAGFSLVATNNSIRNIWLLLVSLWFYFRAGGLFIVLLLFTSLVNYTCGLLISSSSRRGIRRLWLSVSVVTGLGLLGYYKYAAFFIGIINPALGTSLVPFDYFSELSNSLFGTGFDVSSIILPVGISFFTFQALSYTIDIYRNKVDPVKRFTDFAFYVSFFPHLVAGPIVRASEFVPQMYARYSLSKNEWSHALFLIIQGLIKKMVISDFIAGSFVDRVFVSPALYSGFENLLSVYGYGIQIYCDFSGYTDIAIGIALLMGFRLPVNFNSPYKAANIADFWKRWHISLSRWLKDYLYIPLGGNRKGSFRTGVNLLVTMLLGGLWHGASLKFVVWGGLHGAGLVINKIWRRIFSGSKPGRWFSRVLGIIITFNFVNFAWIFFRTNSFSDAMIMINRIFTAFDPGSYRVVISAYLPALLLILTGYFLHFVPYSVKESYRGIFIKMPVAVKFALILMVCLLIHKTGLEATQPFIYFRF